MSVSPGGLEGLFKDHLNRYAVSRLDIAYLFVQIKDSSEQELHLLSSSMNGMPFSRRIDTMRMHRKNILICCKDFLKEKNRKIL